MDKYQKILLCVELIPESDAPVIRKAIELASKYHSRLWVVHAVESYPFVYGGAMTVDIEKDLIASAKVMMADLQKQLPKNIATAVLVKSGSAKHVIVEEAQNNGVELIVVGSHGRQGVRLLLGSTANAVIHGAHCDVLAVRV
jgi:universal stress protein A